MSRKLTPASSLENLKRETKRWLSALRNGDPQGNSARVAELLDAHPDIIDERIPLRADVNGEDAAGLTPTPTCGSAST